MVVLSITPALGNDTYPIPPEQIPYTSILPNKRVQPVPVFIGQPAVAIPVPPTPVPQNPFMAQDPWSCIHNDGYQSDTYPHAGPLGKSPVVSSTYLAPPDSPIALSDGMVFDRLNNFVVAAAIKSDETNKAAWVEFTLIDARNLDTLARFPLPREAAVDLSFRPAGTYFYLDHNNRIVVGTKDHTVWLISYAHDAGGIWSFFHDDKDTYALTQAIPDSDSIQALQPDWSGRVWFTSKSGVVGTLNMDTEM